MNSAAVVMGHASRAFSADTRKTIGEVSRLDADHAQFANMQVETFDEKGEPDGYFDVHQYIALCKAHYDKVGLGAALIDKLYREVDGVPLKGPNDIVIYTVGKDGHILETNDAASKLYGYTSAQFLTQKLQSLDTGERMIQHASRVRYETAHRSASGKLLPVDVHIPVAAATPTRPAILLMRLLV